jgi:hypothetical protein
VTLENTGPQSDLPFRRWREAIAALAAAERDDPYSLETDQLAADVIAARLVLTQARVADGWTLPEIAADQLATDAWILKQGIGAVAAFLPAYNQPGAITALTAD